MSTAYSSNGKAIGKFDGAFVVNSSENRVYWVSDGDVLTKLTFGREFGIDRRLWSMIGKFDGKVARDENGLVIFALH